jgi:hypothetical protein
VRAPSWQLRERARRLAAGVRRWFVEQRGYRFIVLLCACGFVELGYVFITSAGTMTNWPTYSTRVDELAEAFRAGQLHLKLEPPAALVSAKNPLDPANASLWYWDASLYKGHFYFYWGPVPALLLAAAKTTFSFPTTLGDEVTVFGLTSLTFLSGAVLLGRLAARLFHGIPVALVAVAIVAFGLSNPAPFILGRPEIYESAIVGGHAFALSGIALAFEAVLSAEHSRRSLLFAAAAGTCWALALGCRITLAPALLALAFTTAVAIALHGTSRWRRLAKSLVAIGLPLALGAAGLLLYNKARFDQWLEFGTRYQMTWIDFKLSGAYVPANAYSYSFRPLQTSCTFPFVFSPIGLTPDRVFPNGFTLPPHYFVYEQVSGVFVTTPWAWLCVPALVFLTALAWRAFRRRSSLDAICVARIWALLSLLVASSLLPAVPLAFNTATMRYLGDAAGAFMVLAGLGAFVTYAVLRRVALARRLAIVVLACAALCSVAVGLGLGVEGYYKHFLRHNPELLQKLEQRFSICPP